MYDPNLHYGMHALFNPVIMLLILASYASFFFFLLVQMSHQMGDYFFFCWGESGMSHECKASDISLTQGSACKMSSLLAISRLNPEKCDKMTSARIFTVVRFFSNCHHKPQAAFLNVKRHYSLIFLLISLCTDLLQANCLCGGDLWTKKETIYHHHLESMSESNTHPLPPLQWLHKQPLRLLIDNYPYLQMSPVTRKQIRREGSRAGRQRSMGGLLHFIRHTLRDGGATE